MKTKEDFYKDGDRVLVHSFGDKENATCLGTVVGLASDYITQIYIVELDKPIPKPWGRYNYRCINVPDGCLSISEEFTIEDWKGEVKGLMQECDDYVKRIKELERKVVNSDIECPVPKPEQIKMCKCGGVEHHYHKEIVECSKCYKESHYINSFGNCLVCTNLEYH